MSKTITIIRIILEIGILTGIYFETGIFTLIFTALMTIYVHLNDSSIKGLFELINGLIEGEYKDFDHILKEHFNKKRNKL